MSTRRFRRQHSLDNSRRLRLEPLEPRVLLAVNVVPSVETASAAGADDVAIWIHPTDPAKSTVIGTVKTSSSSLRVYNLAGQQLQSVSVPRVNNVDLRYNFPLGGESVTLVAGSNRANNSIVLYRVDDATGLLSNVAARTIVTGMAVYGCAMYVSPASGNHFVFVSSESGQIQQWELLATGAGTVDAALVRSFSVGSRVEGIVADDVHGQLYVGEENVAVWKLSAEPTGGTGRFQVDTTGSGGHLAADVEGLTIYYASDSTGYLIASSQGNDEFVVYRREGNNDFVGSFKLVAGGGIDAVTDTDGIDVTNFPLGGEFSYGMFVAQDNDQNFKLTRWDAIDAAFGGVLDTDTTWDPRLVGRAVSPPGLPGDYNSDGIVDAADYTVWREALSESVEKYSGADGSGNGLVDEADYQVWSDNFGRTTVSAILPIETTVSVGATAAGGAAAFGVDPFRDRSAGSRSIGPRVVVGNEEVVNICHDSGLMAWLTASARKTKGAVGEISWRNVSTAMSREGLGDWPALGALDAAFAVCGTPNYGR